MKKTYLSHNKNKKKLSRLTRDELRKKRRKEGFGSFSSRFLHWRLFCFYIFCYFIPALFFCFFVFCSKVNFNREFRSNWRCLRKKKPLQTRNVPLPERRFSPCGVIPLSWISQRLHVKIGHWDTGRDLLTGCSVDENMVPCLVENLWF